MQTITIKLLLPLVPILTLLTACGGVATCNDPKVKDTIVEMINNQVKDAVWAQDLFDNGWITNIQLADIRTTGHDEELDSYSCAAEYHFDYRGHPQAKAVSYNLTYVEDRKDTRIEVFGIEAIKTRMMTLAMFFK